MKEVPYTEAIRRKFPEQVAYIVSRTTEGKTNIMVVGWIMPTSHKPPMLATSIAPERYTHDIITETKEFVVAFPNSRMVEQMLICGTKSGRDIDKVAESGHVTLPAREISVPLIAECVANFECVVDGTLKSGDHTIFAGCVVASHIEESIDVGRLYNFNNDFGPARRG